MAVHELADFHGYQPNNIASSLRKGKTFTIGVVVPRIDRHFFSNIIGGMEEVLNSAGYNLVICQSNEDFYTEAENLKSLSNLRVDALFISMAATTNDVSHIQEIIDHGTRVIMFDRIDDNIKAPKVVLDDYQGAFSMVEHLIKQGYQKIYHFSGPDNLKVYRDRKQGYLDAMNRNGLSTDPGMIINNAITREKGYEAFDTLYQEKKQIDAVFCASDFSALGVLLAARKNSLNPPEDIGIAGFSNEPFTEFIQPGISSIDQKAKLMGQKVAEIYLENKKIEKEQNFIIQPELIIRNSTKKLNKN